MVNNVQSSDHIRLSLSFGASLNKLLPKIPRIHVCRQKHVVWIVNSKQPVATCIARPKLLVTLISASLKTHLESEDDASGNDGDWRLSIIQPCTIVRIDWSRKVLEPPTLANR
jgi:hypothetical protein